MYRKWKLLLIEHASNNGINSAIQPSIKVTSFLFVYFCSGLYCIVKGSDLNFLTCSSTRKSKCDMGSLNQHHSAVLQINLRDLCSLGLEILPKLRCNSQHFTCHLSQFASLVPSATLEATAYALIAHADPRHESPNLPVRAIEPRNSASNA